MGVCPSKLQEENVENLSTIHRSDFKEIIAGDEHASEVVIIQKATIGEVCQLNKPTITLESFTLIKVLGRGGQGKVLLVQLKGTSKYYAMKILRKDRIEQKQQRLYTQNERDILVMLSHPFTVKLYYAFQTPVKLYLIMDFVEGGELFYHLSKVKRVDEQVAQFYAAEILLTLEYLHAMKIIYRDLKPENILLDAQGHIRITDFGLCKLNCNEGDLTHTICGTYEYMAPEVMIQKGHDHRVDFYSLGALLYLMLHGIPPNYSKNRQQMITNRLEKPVRLRPNLSENTASILNGLLTVSADRRLGANGIEEIKQHPFFEGIDWFALYRKRVKPPQIFCTNSANRFDNFQKFAQETAEDSIVPLPHKPEQYEKFSYIPHGGPSQTQTSRANTSHDLKE